MNFGIIGSGSIARAHAAAVRAIDGSELRSIYGRNRSTAAALAAEAGCDAVDDLDRFLADPELDIAIIATPSGAHLEPTEAALDAGKHVICEKPLEVTAERIDRMIAAARRNDRVLAGIFNRRFHPTIGEIDAALGAGRLGTMVSASCQVKWFRDQAYYDSAPWRGTRALDGGGALMNQAIHAVDLLLRFAGPVRSLSASTACLAHQRIEVEDCAVAVLEFASGARGVIEASTACWSATGHPVRIQLCGSGGSIFLADESLEAWEFADPLPGDDAIRARHTARPDAALGATAPMAIHADGHRRNFEEVIAAIREGRQPSTHPDSARAAVELILAIYRSADAGGTPVEP